MPPYQRRIAKNPGRHGPGASLSSIARHRENAGRRLADVAMRAKVRSGLDYTAIALRMAEHGYPMTDRVLGCVMRDQNDGPPAGGAVVALARALGQDEFEWCGIALRMHPEFEMLFLKSAGTRAVARELMRSGLTGREYGEVVRLIRGIVARRGGGSAEGA